VEILVLLSVNIPLRLTVAVAGTDLRAADQGQVPFHNERESVLAEIGFRVIAGKCVLRALPSLGKSKLCNYNQDVRITFTGVPKKSLYFDSTVNYSTLLDSFLMPPFVGCGVQTLPLMIGPDQKHYLEEILAKSTDPFSVPIISVPEVLKRIKKCSNHASEVLLILHVLTVEIRDFKEHRIDIFYIEEMEPLLYSEFAHEGYRRMFSIFLPDFGALMIHSSALMRNGRVMMFLAADEGGKSTAVGLSLEGEVLSDDRNILKRNGTGFNVHPTPWGKICNLEISAPLGGMFLLEKADTFSLEPLDPRVLVYFLWEDNRPFWDLLPIARRIKALDLLIAASRSVPVYRMRFPKDYIDWTTLDKAVAD
jgi:hypothetical protein